MSIRFEVRLRSIEQHIRRKHGKDRKPTPNETMIVANYADDIVTYIQNRWPVDTGTSRDNFRYQLRFNVGELIINVINPMYYAEYVHYAGGSDNFPLWESLLPEAFQTIAPEMNSAVMAEIDKTERVLAEKIRRQQSQQATNNALLELIRRPIDIDFFDGFFNER